MKIHRFRNLGPALLCALTSLALRLPAQEDPPPPPPARLRFLILEESPGSYSLKTGGEFRSLVSAPYSISAPYSPPDFSEIEVYKDSPTRNPETGEPTRIRVATLTPPRESGTALVILKPRADPSRQLPFDVEVIDSDPAAWPAGSLRILNRGRVPMAVVLGEDTVSVAPNALRVVRPRVTDTRHRIRASVATQTESGWELIDDRIAVLPPQSRLTGIMLYSPSGLRFRFDDEMIAQRGPPPPSHVWLTFRDTPQP